MMVQNSTENIRNFFRSRSALSVLIIINLTVFIAVQLFNLFCFLYQINPEVTSGALKISRIAYYLAIPSNPDLLLTRPWTMLTYMFLQEDLLHILFNMLMLYFGGMLFTEYLGGKKLVSTYIWGGIAGALVYILSFNLFPAFAEVSKYSVALGSSASVLAIFIAIATFVPDLSVSLFLFGKIKLKYIAIVFVAIDLLSIEKGNPGGHLAHLGGAMWGFFYIKTLKIFPGMNKIASQFNHLIRKFVSPKPKMKAEYGKRPMSDDEFNRMKAENQKRIDSILDKISKAGYDSLSKDEKEFLFKASNKK